MKNYTIGADIGGSHISCAVIDMNKKVILRETYATQPLDNKDQADHILKNWVIALKKSLSFIDINELAGIGFAMPGPFDYEKGIALFTNANDKYESLYGVDVAQHIKDVFALKSASDVRFMNDASSFAVGEAWFGKVANVEKSVCITLGTGFGSAFIEHGIPVVERDDVPKMGCVWHLPFNHSIADDSFSTRWFIKTFAERTGLQMRGVKEIADCVKSDSRALDIFEEFGTNLGEFLGPWLAKFKADALVIGGNISAAYTLFGNCLVASLKEQSVKTNIYISELKEDAAIIGSARLFEKDFWNEVKPLLSKM